MRYITVLCLVFLSASVGGASPLGISNAGFEGSGVLFGLNASCSGWLSGADYLYQPSGCGMAWTFQGNSGLTESPSAFNNPVGPDGSLEAAFLQGIGDFYQNIDGVDVGGVYTISFYAYQRDCCDAAGSETIGVSFGGIQLTFDGAAIVQPALGAGWVQYTTDPFVAPSNSNLLQFSGLYSPHDASVFIDVISSDESAVVPEPGSWGLLAGGLGLVLAGRRRK
jgi:hypothetical protein